MKKLFLFVLLFTTISVFAEEGKVKQVPAKPTINDIISISFYPENETSTIKNPSHMIVEIVFWKATEDYIFKQIQMLKEGNNFTANISIPNDSIVYITYKFRSEKSVDDNNSRWWETFIYNDKGIELQGGHYQKALSSLFPQDLTRSLATTDAIKELEREVELYPNNIYAKQTIWLNDIKQSNEKEEVVKDIQNKLREASGQWKNDENAMYYIAYAADYIKMKDLVDSIYSYYLTKNPKGKIVRLLKYNEVMKEKNTEIKLALIKDYLETYDNAEVAWKDVLVAAIYDIYLQKQDNVSIKEFFSKYSFNEIFYYINLGEIELNNGGNLKELSAFLDPPINRLKAASPDLKPAYMSDLTFQSDINYKLGILSAMKGRIVFELQDTLQAIPYLDIYYKNLVADRNDYNALYVECLTKAGRYEDVIRVSSEIIRADKFMPGVEKYYESAYEKVTGSKEGFDEKLKEDKAQRKRTQTSNLIRNRIEKLAPDFELKDLDGKTVTLADLKGKIVIIDFWAIWCGPCRTALPFFQQAYEKYKTNENVKFIAINTLEKIKPEEKVKSIKSFLNSNNFSFPVLIDDSTSRLVEKLGVGSIPTKFAIDKDGYVQFTSVGFNGAEEMLNEIDLWIEILMKKK